GLSRRRPRSVVPFGRLESERNHATAELFAEDAFDRLHGFVDDLADGGFGAGDAVDDLFGRLGDAGVFEGSSGHRLINRVDGLVDGAGDRPGGRGGGPPTASFSA